MSAWMDSAEVDAAVGSAVAKRLNAYGWSRLPEASQDTRSTFALSRPVDPPARVAKAPGVPSLASTSRASALEDPAAATHAAQAHASTAERTTTPLTDGTVPSRVESILQQAHSFAERERKKMDTRGVFSPDVNATRSRSLERIAIFRAAHSKQAFPRARSPTSAATSQGGTAHETGGGATMRAESSSAQAGLTNDAVLADLHERFGKHRLLVDPDNLPAAPRNARNRKAEQKKPRIGDEAAAIWHDRYQKYVQTELSRRSHVRTCIVVLLAQLATFHAYNNSSHMCVPLLLTRRKYGDRKMRMQWFRRRTRETRSWIK